MADSVGKVNENKNNNLIDPVYQKYVKSVLRALGSSQFYEFFMDSISRAENEFQFSNRRMEKFVDTAWVDAIEQSLEGFQNIISSPRNIIKEEELVVNVANARKAGSDVVRHLATHAALVENYDEQTGDVRPSMLMQKYREDSVGLYENRLVFTTLEQAFHFVKLRHDALFQSMGDEFGAKLKVKSDLSSATESVHMDLFMHIRDIDSAIETDDKNRDVFERISRLYRILSMEMNSRFAQQMAKFPRIKGAITKTNILKKDPNYRQIIALWEFLKGYDSVGYTIKIVEQNPVISETFQRDIYHNILFNYLVLKGHLDRDKDRLLPAPLKEKRRSLKPKMIKEIIEELTEDYDLPDVEIRKVLIEELTKEQLLQQEAAERRRLVEERAQRKKEEAERLRQEREAEKERLRKEREAELERKRQEKAAEAERLLCERMEREQEERRRSGLFKKEIEYFRAHFEENAAARLAEAQKEESAKQDFEDAILILEETERWKAEEAEREKLRRREERERKKREALLAQQQALREAEEEKERQLQAKRAEEERLKREQEEQEELARRKQMEQDLERVKCYLQELEQFRISIPQRVQMRQAQLEQICRDLEEREQERQRRKNLRTSAGR